MSKDKATDAIVAYITSGDERGALRFYIENRVSFATYSAAVSKGRQIVRRFEGRAR